MKKLLLISPILIMMSCGSTHSYIQHSDVAIVSSDLKHIYICNMNHGPMIYDCWARGCYGDTTQAHLLDSTEFSQKAVECTCNTNNHNRKDYSSVKIK